MRPLAIISCHIYKLDGAERRKVNVLEIKCLRSLVGVSRMDRVSNEEVHRRAGIERELVSRADQSIEMVWACVKNGQVLHGQKGPLNFFFWLN